MPQSDHYHSVITDSFFKPLFEQLAGCSNQRRCQAVPDADRLEFGARRCLSTCRSGRDFLRHLSDCHDIDLDVETYFETLKSNRRLTLVSELNARLRMREELADPFAQFESLKNFEIFAGDGHVHAASCHDSSPTDTSHRSSQGGSMVGESPCRVNLVGLPSVPSAGRDGSGMPGRSSMPCRGGTFKEALSWVIASGNASPGSGQNGRELRWPGENHKMSIRYNPFRPDYLVSPDIEIFGTLAPAMKESYLDRVRLLGEFDAVRWLNQQIGERAGE